MNRIDRISTILIQLQSRKVVRAEDIAVRFGISIRTVYRDIKTIIEAGVPLISEPGIGYSIMDGYRLPPVHFTVEEATAFLTAEKLIEKLGDKDMGDHYNSAMYKIRAVLKSQDKAFLDTIESAISVKENHFVPRKLAEKGMLDLILRCIYHQQQLHLEYRAAYNMETSHRVVEAIGIVFQSGNWMLIAYCHLRNDYRTFRIDRIIDARPLDRPYEAKHPALVKFLEKVSNEKELTKVVIEIPKKTFSYLGDQKYYMGFVSEEQVEDRVRLTFLTWCKWSFTRWYITLGEQVSILEPLSLKTIIKSTLIAQLNQLESSEKLAQKNTLRVPD